MREVDAEVQKTFDTNYILSFLATCAHFGSEPMDAARIQLAERIFRSDSLRIYIYMPASASARVIINNPSLYVSAALETFYLPACGSIYGKSGLILSHVILSYIFPCY